jgi:hypothetical protein
MTTNRCRHLHLLGRVDVTLEMYTLSFRPPSRWPATPRARDGRDWSRVHSGSRYTLLLSVSLGYCAVRKRGRFPHHTEEIGSFPATSVAVGRSLNPSRGRRFKSRPRYKVKPQFRVHFQTHPEAGSGVAGGPMSAGCQQALGSAPRPVSTCGAERCPRTYNLWVNVPGVGNSGPTVSDVDERQ